MARFETCCTTCGSVNVAIKALEADSLKFTCRDCFSSDTISSKSEAGRFTMPIGKYRGYSLSDIAEMDRGYIQWGAENLKGSVGDKVRAFAAEL